MHKNSSVTTSEESSTSKEKTRTALISLTLGSFHSTKHMPSDLVFTHIKYYCFSFTGETNQTSETSDNMLMIT